MSLEWRLPDGASIFGGPLSPMELIERHNLSDEALELRRRCIASPLFLGAEVMYGYMPREQNLLLRPSTAHLEVEDSMIRQESRIYVDHRGTLKTTVEDIIGTVWQLLKYPDDRVCLLQTNTRNALSMSKQVRDHFVRNTALRTLFPEYAMSPSEGEGESWSVPCRRTISQEGSVTAASPETSTTGLHFEVIKASDLMNPTTVPPPCGMATINAMKAVISWYASTDGLLLHRSQCARAHRTIDCMVAGTPILLADGSWAPIESVAVGARVPCWNGERGLTTGTVTWSGFVKRDKVYKVRTGTSSVRCSGGHKFLVLPWHNAQGDKCHAPEWRRADELRKADRILVAARLATEIPSERNQTWGDDFHWTRVRSVEVEAEEADLFDLTVDEHHSYVADGLVVHNSNRWHDADHVGQLLRTDKDNVFRKIIRGVKRDANGKFIPTWPEVITSEDLHAINARPTMTPAVWAANFCSDPQPEGGMTFLRQWFRVRGTDWKEYPSDLEIATTCDPAFADKSSKWAATNDRSAIVTTGVSRKTKDLYVLHIEAGRWTPDEFLDHLFSIIGFWHPRWVGIEDTGASIALKAMFINRMNTTGQMVPYRTLKMGASRDGPASKPIRMFPLHAHAQNRGIYVTLPEHEPLVEELMRFQVSERDDLADAIAYRGMDMYAASMIDCVPKPQPMSVVPGRQAVTAEELIRRSAERARRGREAPWTRVLRRMA